LGRIRSDRRRKRTRLRLPDRVRGDRGTAVVEFAIILPAFLLILLGVIDFGKVLYYWQSSSQAAATGARAAVVDHWPGDDTGTTLQQWVRSQLKTQELYDDANICVEFPPDGDTSPGNRIEVKVQVPYSLPLVSALAGGNAMLVRGSASMRIEADSASATGVPISSGDDIGTCS
jgi:Flp pilus assembly protein TadG